ncbi:hypothetical protein BAE44_0022047 [Dichanthelium oligosanthes]|uniref:MATH domain-containing protein n=1 Tax=Dichanthelium oligosanthes TaxID=888268 RepID=A0A1E5UVY3_9POAL|nr:hypothetical protein BAE44_0022047 [Dichanthelium oligosanthes]
MASLPTLGGAWRSAREALSFSSTRVRHDTGVHLHRIDRYSKVDGMALPGECIDSAPFRAGGHEWQLLYYPNGANDYSRSSHGRVSVDLRLRPGPWWRLFYDPQDVTAAYTVSVLDADGNQVVSKAVKPHRFGSCWSRAGIEDVATAEKLRSALQGVKEDGLIVRCDVTVINLEKESRIKWYLRQLVKE